MEQVNEQSTAGASGQPDGRPSVVQLNNAQTAAQYECTYTVNCIVHVPGKYRGLISNVPPDVAEILISQGHRAFVKKPAAAI